jgi:hypothetical protein
MSTIHFHQTTTSTPEQFLAALVDCSDRRVSRRRGSSDPAQFCRTAALEDSGAAR